MRMPGRVTRLGMAGALAAILVNPLSGARAAGADVGPSFTGTASATGVDLTITNSSLPLGLSPEGSGPSAQASLDSVGDSSAQAAFPDFGSTVDGLPGLAGALFGNLPLPAYPLVVASNLSNPRVGQGVPGIQLDAQSTPGLSEGTSVVGAESTGFTSTAEVQQLSDGSVQASGQSTFGIDLLGLVSISGVSSQAQVTASADTGALTRTSHLSIGQISVAGLSLVIPPSSPGNIPIPVPVPGLPQLPPLKLPTLPLPLGGTTLPIPDIGFEDGTFTVTLPLLDKGVKFALPASLVLSAFKALGITVTYQTAQDTPTGVSAPALTFAFDVPSPPKNNYLNGPTGVSFELGASTANVTLHPALSNPGSFGGGTGSTGAISAVAPTGTGGNGVLGGATTPIVGTGSAGSSPAMSGTTPSITASPPRTVRLTASVNPLEGDLSGVYLAVVAVAVVALAAASILRLLGVRLLWGS
jgi:hypothetical protein